MLLIFSVNCLIWEESTHSDSESLSASSEWLESRSVPADRASDAKSTPLCITRWTSLTSVQSLHPYLCRTDSSPTSTSLLALHYFHSTRRPTRRPSPMKTPWCIHRLSSHKPPNEFSYEAHGRPKNKLNFSFKLWIFTCLRKRDDKKQEELWRVKTRMATKREKDDF